MDIEETIKRKLPFTKFPFYHITNDFRSLLLDEVVIPDNIESADVLKKWLCDHDITRKPAKKGKKKDKKLWSNYYGMYYDCFHGSNSTFELKKISEDNISVVAKRSNPDLK